MGIGAADGRKIIFVLHVWRRPDLPSDAASRGSGRHSGPPAAAAAHAVVERPQAKAVAPQ
jgi:hypothetical protein